MKRVFTLLVAVLASIVALQAQNVIVVDSEKIFKSQSDYNAALESVDKMSKEYQSQVDAKFKAIEDRFNNYAISRSTYSQSKQQSEESTILKMEQEAEKFQQDIFGKDGTVIKRRIELIAPIQKRVFAAIDKYAQEKGADLVLDKASNASVLYNSERSDCTQVIIDRLK